MSEQAPPKTGPRPPETEEDFTAFINEWKEIDMSTLNLAVDTGRMASRAAGLVWMNRTLMAALLIALGGVGWQIHLGNPQGWSLMYLVLAMLIVFVPLLRWQERALRSARQALGQGSAAEVLEARSRLIRTALQDVQSRPAIAVQAVAVLATGAMAVMAARGDLAWGVPLATGTALGALLVWTYTVRLPRLKRERDIVEALRRELLAEGR